MEQGMLMNSAAASPAASPPLSRTALWFQKEEISWLAVMGLVFLAVNSTSTILRSLHDPTTVAFVVFSNADVVLLYWCMSQFDTAGAKRKESLKAAVWILATLLTGVFCQRIAGMMPPAVDAIVWGMAAPQGEEEAQRCSPASTCSSGNSSPFCQHSSLMKKNQKIENCLLSLTSQ